MTDLCFWWIHYFWNTVCFFPLFYNLHNMFPKFSHSTKTLVCEKHSVLTTEFVDLHLHLIPQSCPLVALTSHLDQQYYLQHTCTVFTSVHQSKQLEWFRYLILNGQPSFKLKLVKYIIPTSFWKIFLMHFAWLE